MQDSLLVIEALTESNNQLQDELNRIRSNNRVLRTVVRALRASLTTLREQVAAAKENDETFKAFCAGDFDVSVPAGEGGLPEADGTVEAAV